MTRLRDHVTFSVEGIPAPQGSKRHVGNGRLIESSKKVAPWRLAVATAARAQDAIFDAPVSVVVVFLLPKPQRPRHRLHITRPDIDKLARSTLDGLTGALITDDSIVFHLDVSKRYVEAHETPGAVITVTGY